MDISMCEVEISCHFTRLLVGVGGQFLTGVSAHLTNGVKRNDGMYAIRARNLSSVLSGAFFPFSGAVDAEVWGYRRSSAPRIEQQQAVRHLFSGMHPGCVECRHQCHGTCEFDGKLSVVHFRGRYLLYTRANLQREKGGRFVQVTSTAGDDPSGPWGPFQLLQIAGYSAAEAGNIYFAAVNKNPFDPRTLLGLFPVAFPRPWMKKGRKVFRGSYLQYGGIGLSLSCDGLRWGPLVSLYFSPARFNRTIHQPVDGVAVVNDSLIVLVHLHVPGIANGGHRELLPLSLNREALDLLTQAAHKTLPGCEPPGG